MTQEVPCADSKNSLSAYSPSLVYYVHKFQTPWQCNKPEIASKLRALSIDRLTFLLDHTPLSLSNLQVVLLPMLCTNPLQQRESLMGKYQPAFLLHSVGVYSDIQKLFRDRTMSTKNNCNRNPPNDFIVINIHLEGNINLKSGFADIRSVPNHHYKFPLTHRLTHAGTWYYWCPEHI